MTGPVAPRVASTVALVVAAGRGSRFDGGVPKQYAALGGRPLLGHSLEAFARHPRIDQVKAVIHPDDRALYERAAAGLDLREPAAGGATRQDSVRRGLESLEALAPEAVLIHDGARPFVDATVIDRVLDALASAPGAIAALPVTDTLKRGAAGKHGEAGKRGEAGHIAATLERAGLWRAQTPQGFRFAEILAAHRAVQGAVQEAAAGPVLTDDAAVAERAGLAARPGLAPLQGVGHGQRRDRAGRRGERVEHPVDHGGVDERPRAVVDQHRLRRQRLQALQSAAHGVLARRAPGRGLQEIEPGRGTFVERPVVRVDDRLDPVDPWVPGEGLEAVAEQRPAAERGVLLGHLSAEAAAASRRHHERHI